MISKFINQKLKLNPLKSQVFQFFKRKLKHPIQPDIILVGFINYYLDTYGWYTFGHHSKQKFLARVKQREPHALLSLAEVRRSHAILSPDRQFEEVPRSHPGAKPVTIIEFFA